MDITRIKVIREQVVTINSTVDLKWEATSLRATTIQWCKMIQELRTDLSILSIKATLRCSEATRKLAELLHIPAWQGSHRQATMEAVTSQLTTKILTTAQVLKCRTITWALKAKVGSLGLTLRSTGSKRLRPGTSTNTKTTQSTEVSKLKEFNLLTKLQINTIPKIQILIKIMLIRP